MARPVGILILVVAVAISGCSSSSHKSEPTPTTSAPSTRPTTRSTTGSTRPAAPGSGCDASADPDRVSVVGQAHSWIQMVGATRGYAVIGDAVVGSGDGRHWRTLARTGDNLSYVDAVDATHVWAVGARSLFVSADGGSNWTTITTAPRALEMVHFVDADRGWAVASGSLLQSLDSGRSWRVVPAPCPVDRVCFDDPLHGWIATHTAAYVTVDGGAHWTHALQVRDTSTLGGVAIDLQCTPANSAWILFGGGNGATGHNAYIGYRCTNPGACAVVLRNNYYPPGVPGVDGPGASAGPFSVIDEHTAVFAGFTGPLDDPTSVMTVSDDGRGRGQVFTVHDGPPEQAAAAAVSFTSRDRGWMVDGIIGASHILATTDGGETWTVQYATLGP